MSIRLPPPANIAQQTDRDSDSSDSESDDDDDQNWEDWASDSLIQVPCPSFFDDKTFTSAEEALSYDKVTHRFDLDSFCSKLSLDFYGRIRLVNYIRKTKPTPLDLSRLNGSESFFTSDDYLLPSLENDPLLQVQPGQWSDSDSEDAGDLKPEQQIRALKRKIVSSERAFVEYRALINKKLNIQNLLDAPLEPGPTQSSAPHRDDDTHYFNSYAENDIHAVMIQDKVRTSTYAHFILTNPILFRDATVLDVGCGTGILSLFAARSGAKRVIAVEASDIAEKAERIVKANGFEDIITVIRGKVEEINLPDDVQRVDIIISEWMGYALLYESMLDSVLHARDRFLRPGGVMAPSQCKMKLALCDASEVYKNHIGFWNDVYGLDLSIMAEGIQDEAIVDIVGPDSLLSNPITIKDLILNDVTPRQLKFSSSFTLVSTSARRTKLNSFVLYFDTFFTVSGGPVSESTGVKVVKEGDVVLAEIWPAGGKPAPQRRRSQGADRNAVASFSTGPTSIPTHWKQTIFLLRDPIVITEGSIVQGTFYCRKSEENHRELDIEIHFSVNQEPDSPTGPLPLTVQMFKVR